MRYPQSEVNLHTHTVFSKHGKGMPEDYLERASGNGRLKVLGFSEHVPLPQSILPPQRLLFEELPLYVESVRKLRSDSIIVLLGMECDFSPELTSYYRDEVLGEWGCDYILGSVHYLHGDDGRMKYVGDPRTAGVSLSEYVSLYTKMLSSGLFTYGCHPDLFASAFPVWNSETKAASRDIINCAKECGMPLEINGNGFRKRKLTLPDASVRPPYPIREFWEMARDEGIRIVTASDAHEPENVDSFLPAGNFASSLGISWAEYELDSEERKIRIL